MDSSFCIAALDEALARYGKPQIFNTDQGSQFTSEAFTGVLTKNSIAISMDGKGSWRDNVFVERLWRSVKYEDIYIKGYAGAVKPELASANISPTTTSAAIIRRSAIVRPWPSGAIARSKPVGLWTTQTR